MKKLRVTRQQKANEEPPYGEVVPVSVQGTTPALKTELQLTTKLQYKISRKENQAHVQTYMSENL